MLNEIKLDDSASIYTGKYDWTFSKDSFLKRIEQNTQLSNYTIDNTSIMIFNCVEFNHIISLGLDECKKLSNIDDTWDGTWANKTWIYKQDTIKRKEYYHKHLYTTQIPFTTNNAPILNEWTFVFYLQVPNDLIDEEGMIFFKLTEDSLPYKYLPQEGDFIIFPGDLSHLVKNNNNSKTERISICGNISFNIPKVANKKTFI